MAFQDDYIRTAIRLPRDLHAEIQLAAEKAGRSMNAELVARLQASTTTEHLIQESRDLRKRVSTALEERSALEKSLDEIKADIERIKDFLDSKKKPIKP